MAHHGGHYEEDEEDWEWENNSYDDRHPDQEFHKQEPEVGERVVVRLLSGPLRSGTLETHVKGKHGRDHPARPRGTPSSHSRPTARRPSAHQQHAHHTSARLAPLLPSPRATRSPHDFAALPDLTEQEKRSSQEYTQFLAMLQQKRAEYGLSHKGGAGETFFPLALPGTAPAHSAPPAEAPPASTPAPAPAPRSASTRLHHSQHQHSPQQQPPHPPPLAPKATKGGKKAKAGGKRGSRKAGQKKTSVGGTVAPGFRGPSPYTGISAFFAAVEDPEGAGADDQQEEGEEEGEEEEGEEGDGGEEEDEARRLREYDANEERVRGQLAELEARRQRLAAQQQQLVQQQERERQQYHHQQQLLQQQEREQQQQQQEYQYQQQQYQQQQYQQQQFQQQQQYQQPPPPPPLQPQQPRVVYNVAVARSKAPIRANLYLPGSDAPYVDLRTQLPPVSDQGPLPASAAFALAAAYECSDGTDFQASPGFLYYTQRFLGLEDSAEGYLPEDRPDTMESAVSRLVETGLCSEALLPYDPLGFVPDAQGLIQFCPPDEAAWAEADARRAECHRIKNDVPAMRRCLSSGFPIVAAVAVFGGMERVDSTGMVDMPGPSERPLGGQAVVIVGYDDECDEGVWILRNSLGAGWGAEGHCYVPYAYERYFGDLWFIVCDK